MRIATTPNSRAAGGAGRHNGNRGVPAFARLFDYCSDAVLVARRDGAIRYVNPALSRWLGPAAPALTGQPVARFLQLPRGVAWEALWQAASAPETVLSQTNLYFQPPAGPPLALPLVGATKLPAGDGVVLLARLPAPAGPTGWEEALQRSEANVQALLDTSPQAYFMLGRQYEILKWNAVGEKYIRMIWGKTVREGDSMLWYSNPADEADFRKDFALAMAGKKVEIEKGITYPNGVQIWYEIKYLPIHNREGQPYAVAFSAVDITARKQNELALQKLSLVAQQTDNAVIITDRAGVTEWVNEGFTRITGYAPGEAIGKTPGALLQGPSPDPALTAFMRGRIAAGEGFKTEIINYHKNGTPYWLALSVSPLRNADGAVTGFIAIESDVTERKKLEEETRRSLATLQAVQESTHDVIFALDCHYCYLSFNSVHARTMQAIFGITIRPGMNALAIMAHLPDGAREKDRLDRALAGEQYTVEDAFGDRAHDRRYFEVSYNPIRNADGRVHGVAIFSQDITGRKRAEREREQLLRELQNYKRVLDASALISITDAEGRITYVNDLFCNTTGYGPGELLGQTHRLVNAGYHPKSFFCPLVEHHPGRQVVAGRNLQPVQERQALLGGHDHLPDHRRERHDHAVHLHPLRDHQAQTGRRANPQKRTRPQGSPVGGPHRQLGVRRGGRPAPLFGRGVQHPGVGQSPGAAVLPAGPGALPPRRRGGLRATGAPGHSEGPGVPYRHPRHHARGRGEIRERDRAAPEGQKRQSVQVDRYGNGR